MVKQWKKDAVAEVQKKVQGAKSVILADFCGLTVEEMTELRRRLRREEVEFRVIKNRLIKRALAEAGGENLDEHLIGPTALAFGYSDPVIAAKVLYDYRKENAKLGIKAGLLEGKKVSVEEIEALAQVPPREELFGRLLGSVQRPAQSLVYGIKATVSQLVYALHALSEQKGQEAGS
jgi:large subunit ribosomal protein L10